jgi:hypothetical protein
LPVLVASRPRAFHDRAMPGWPRTGSSLLGLSLLAAASGGCHASPSTAGSFAALAQDAPSDQPLLLTFAGDAVASVAVPLGPGALDARLRAAVDAIEPGGRTVLVAREWGPRGDGYRIEKRYGDGLAEQFRSLLLSADAIVLERSHSVSVNETPPAVLTAATAATRRAVLRIDIVSGPSTEEYFRLLLRDGGGRRFAVECTPSGAVLATRRLLDAQVQVR